MFQLAPQGDRRAQRMGYSPVPEAAQEESLAKLTEPRELEKRKPAGDMDDADDVPPVVPMTLDLPYRCRGWGGSTLAMQLSQDFATLTGLTCRESIHLN